MNNYTSISIEKMKSIQNTKGYQKSSKPGAMISILIKLGFQLLMENKTTNVLLVVKM